MENTQKIEFSRPVRIKDLKKRVTHIDIEAAPSELQALATRFGLPDIAALRAKVRVERVAHDRTVRIDGKILARLSYLSVVSLETFEADIAESFSEILSNEEAPLTETEIELPPDNEIMGVIEDGRFDLGEMLSQNLALLLDEHPRKPDEGNTQDGVVWEDTELEDPVQNPFSILSDMRDRLRKGD